MRSEAPQFADQLAGELARRGAILDGHFRLSSGRHSGRFIQKFRMLEDPRLVELVARAIADRARVYEPTVVVSAAVGGIVLGYEVARQLGTLALFVEKERDVPALRRGFRLGPGDRALVVEDVVTTGLSIREVIDVVRAAGASIGAVAIVVQREPVDFGIPTIVLLEVPVESYEPADCPLCARGVPLTDPGSRRA
jgi:orotate phosphoribosyltransferase